MVPGLRICDNYVIGAGSEMTRDVPANVAAAGMPCQVIKSTAKLSREEESLECGLHACVSICVGDLTHKKWPKAINFRPFENQK